MTARQKPDTTLLWLTEQRDAGRGEHDQASANATLEHIRDQVVAGAQLGPGHHVLDLGAGTGLIATAAASIVGPTGRVLALDRSGAALRHIDAGAGALLGRAVADAHHLPLASSSLDAVCARSVLIYLADLPGALAEVARVLRPGGRLSVFEPVNRERTLDAALPGMTTRELAAVEELRRRSSGVAPIMMAFDELTLTAAARVGGFTDLEVRRDAYRETFVDAGAVEAHLRRSPHPGALSPLDAIAQQLGAGLAERYLAAWKQALRGHPNHQLVLTTPLLYFMATRGPAAPAMSPR